MRFLPKHHQAYTFVDYAQSYAFSANKKAVNDYMGSSTKRDNLHSIVTELSHTPKEPDLLCLQDSIFLHACFELDIIMTQNNQTSSFLFSLAYQHQLIHAPPHEYVLYYTTRTHLYDETKCMCECFFLQRTNIPLSQRTRIITNEIFLPLALFALNPKLTHFLCIINSSLYYYEHGILKEVRDNCDTKHISEDLAYFKDVYQKDFEYVYSFDENSSAPYCFIGNLLDLAPQESSLFVDSKIEIRIMLCLAYLHQSHNKSIYDSLSHLPNFYKAPHILYRYAPALIALCILSIVVIPLFIALLNMRLESQITSLHTQNKELLTTHQAMLDSPSHDALAPLQAERDFFIANLHDLYQWQHSYHARYDFMHTLFQSCSAFHIRIERVSFVFSQKVQLARIKVSAQNQTTLLSLLARLNTSTQTAHNIASEHNSESASLEILVISYV